MKNRKRRRPIRQMARTLVGWRQRFRDYAERCLQSGFIPLTFGPVQFITRLLAKAMVAIQLGRMHVIGRENLHVPGRFIFCPNHSSMFDAPVLYSIIRRQEAVRYMTAYEEMRGMWGLKAILMGAMGCFPVDRSRGKSVIEPAVNVIVRGNCLTIFPEGRVSETAACQPFKKGAAIIARAANEVLGGKERIGMVPVHIEYHRRHDPTARTNYFKMGLKWRGGVTVTVGKPLYLDTDLAGLSAQEIMERLHAFVCHAQEQSQTNASGCPCNDKPKVA